MRGRPGLEGSRDLGGREGPWDPMSIFPAEGGDATSDGARSMPRGPGAGWAMGERKGGGKFKQNKKAPQKLPTLTTHP